MGHDEQQLVHMSYNFIKLHKQLLKNPTASVAETRVFR